MEDLAPIILFGYNRPIHFEKCLYSLMQNELAQFSSLYIYIDKVNDENDLENKHKNEAVIKIANEKKWCGECNIIIRDENFGIEKNTIAAVNELITKFNKVIVLEDDLIVSNSFLTFMNKNLIHYETTNEIMQIGGCNLIENVVSKYDSILLPITTSWGWATWKRVWDKVPFDHKNNLLLNERYLFDLESSFPYYKMFKEQLHIKNENTWDIQFWKYVLKSKGLVLYPKNNLVLNMGFDGSGIHYTEAMDVKQKKVFNNQKFELFPTNIIFENKHFIQLKHTLLKLHQPLKGIVVNYMNYYLKKIINYNNSMNKYYQKNKRK